MRINTLESILCAGMFTLTAAAFPHPCHAQQEDPPFTQKFKNAPLDDQGGPPPAGGKDESQQQQGGPQGQRGMGLSEEDRARMKSIQEKLAKEPDVQAAREAVKNAKTKEDRQKAMKSFKEVMDKHLSAEDRAFMDKIRKQHPHGQGHGGHHGGGPPSGSEGSSGVEGGGGPQGQGGPGGGSGDGHQHRRKGPPGGDGSQGSGGQGGESGKPGVDGLFGPGGGGEGGSGGRPSDGRASPPSGAGEGESGPEGGRPQGDGPGFGGGDRHQGGPDGGGRPMMTDEQRQRFKSIRDKYKDDPDMKKAREAVKEAVTPEEKELAIEEYRATMQKKMSPEDRAFFDELKKSWNQRQRPAQTSSGDGGERF